MRIPVGTIRDARFGVLFGCRGGRPAGSGSAACRSGASWLRTGRSTTSNWPSRAAARGIEGVRGRILYDFSGNACEGYELQFRQVSELDSGEGKAALSDLRSTTWEDGDAKKFRFNSENLFNEQQTDIVDGHAERNEKAVAVSLSKPKARNFTVPSTAVFPTEHMRRIIVGGARR